MKIIEFHQGMREYPQSFKQLAAPPQKLYCLGPIADILERPRLSVIGTRRATPYGKAITQQLVTEAVRMGVAIVSGLALGIDGIAHRTALSEKGKTLAVMAHGLDTIYPHSHRQLATDLLASGGVLVSEYPPGTPAYKQNFIARNRLISGLADAILITEAATKSGTMHTAHFALEQGKTVLAVPGNITSELSSGTNNLIKAGAIPVTNIQDIATALGLDATKAQHVAPTAYTAEEAAIINAIHSGISDATELLHASKLELTHFNQTLTLLEIQGKVRPLGNNHWALS